MKKAMCALLVLCLCIGLCACGGTKGTAGQGAVSPTAEQQLIAESVNKTLSGEDFPNWQKLYKEFTGNLPRESEVANVTHYQIDDFDGAAMDCYLVKVSADIAYWTDEASQQGAIENSLYLFVDGTTNTVYDNISTNAMNVQHDTATDYGRATYLVWIYGNAQNGDFTGNYINDSETLTELSNEDLDIINALCFAEEEHTENTDNTVDSDAAEEKESTIESEDTIETDAAESSSHQTGDVTDAAQDVSSAGVLSKEDLCGVYVSSQNKTERQPSKYQFNLDETKAVCVFDYNKNEFVVWGFVYAWNVEGNLLTVYDSLGEGTVVFEVIADNGQVQLKFIETTAGVLDGFPAFLSDMTREEEQSVDNTGVSQYVGVWWSDDDSPGRNKEKQLEFFEDGRLVLDNKTEYQWKDYDGEKFAVYNGDEQLGYGYLAEDNYYGTFFSMETPEDFDLLGSYYPETYFAD